MSEIAAWAGEVRAMREEDLSAVVAIAAVVPTAPHWPPAEFRRMLAVVAQQGHRRGAWVALMGEAVAGFAMASQAAGTAELEAVVTAPDQRRKGTGSALLLTAIAWARNTEADRLQLEARGSNADALRLYLRLGFKKDGLRPGYYRNPDEDAVLLSLAL